MWDIKRPLWAVHNWRLVIISDCFSLKGHPRPVDSPPPELYLEYASCFPYKICFNGRPVNGKIARVLLSGRSCLSEVSSFLVPLCTWVIWVLGVSEG